MDTNAYISRAEFRRWAEAQPRGRFERVNGQVVPMTAERLVHVRLKTAIWRLLDDAARASEVACEALGDGVTVEVGEDTDYEPDVVINLGPEAGPDEIAAPNPVVVVEVLSPGTQSVDTGHKLAGYFSVKSIMHYLVVSASRQHVVHHRRVGDAIVANAVTTGEILLDPPGIAITVNDIYRGIRL